MDVVLVNGCLIPQPVAFPVPGTNQWQLCEDFCLFLPYSKKWLLVKAGYRSDGASIPEILWTPIGNPFEPDYVAAAFGHDPLYEAELLDKHACDKELFHLMRFNSARGHSKSREFFIAVDEFGSSVWDAHTPQSIAAARQLCSIHDSCPSGFESVPVLDIDNEPTWEMVSAYGDITANTGLN